MVDFKKKKDWNNTPNHAGSYKSKNGNRLHVLPQFSVMSNIELSKGIPFNSKESNGDLTTFRTNGWPQ